MPSSDYGIQLTRDDGRVLFDSRTWGPAVYDVVNTADLTTTVLNATTRRATLQYPALVTVAVLSLTRSSFSAIGAALLPTITLQNDTTAETTTVWVDLPTNTIHCTLLITGA